MAAHFCYTRKLMRQPRFGDSRHMRLFTRSLLAASCAFFMQSASHAETLAEIYALAMENDATLKAAEATYQAGKENENLARAGLLPQVAADASYGNTSGDGRSKSDFGAGQTLDRSGDVDLDNNRWGISLQQPIFNLPAWFTFKQGKELSAQAEAQFTAEQENEIVKVAQAYFNVLRAIDNLESVKAEEIATKRQLEQAQQRFDVGLIAITDVHEAQSAYDATVANKLDAQGAVGVAYSALEQLTGRPHDLVGPLKESFPVVNPDPMSRTEWVDFALKNNNRLKASVFAANAAQQNAQAKKAAHLPTLTGALQYQDSENDGKNTGADYLQSQDATTASLNLQVPIFTGGYTSAARRQAVAQSMSAQDIVTATQREVMQNARALHLTVSTDVATVKARKQAITSAKSALEATQAGYEVGTRNVVDVLIAQRNLYAAQRNFANARYDYVTHLFQLKQAAGILTPADIQQVNQWVDGANQINRSKFDNY